jgi:hypothetical protein
LNKQDLNKLIKKHKTAYRAARALKITPQAFYDRMECRGMKRAGYPLLPCEPRPICAKKAWMRGLIRRKTVKQIAREMKRSESAIRSRMHSYGITIRLPLATRVKVLAKLLEKYKTGYAVAKVLKVSPQAVYERMTNHGLK